MGWIGNFLTPVLEVEINRSNIFIRFASHFILVLLSDNMEHWMLILMSCAVEVSHSRFFLILYLLQ